MTPVHGPELRTQDLDPGERQILVGTWSIDASHAMLPGDEIRGEMTFEWPGSHRLLIQRSHYDHPDIRTRSQSSASSTINCRCTTTTPRVETDRPGRRPADLGLLVTWCLVP